MQSAHPVSRERAEMLGSGVADVAFESVLGMMPGPGAHQSIPYHLGHDAGGGDAVAAGIALDDRGGTPAQALGDQVSVDEDVVDSTMMARLSTLDRALHPVQ